MTYYACIGFPVRDARDLRRLEEEAAQSGEEIVSGPGLGLRRWAPGAGVELWAEMGPQGEVLGALPFYDSGRDHLLAVVAANPDPDHPEEGWIEAWINPLDLQEPYSGEFPLVCDLVDYLAAGPILENLPRTVRARLTVFLHEASLFEDELELVEAAQRLGFRLPPRTFASTTHLSLDEGTDRERPEATALLSGRIVQADRVSNPLTGHPFLALAVDVGKVTLDAVAPAELLPDVERRLLRGALLLQGAGWVLGKIVAYPPNMTDSSARR